jgi:hypothetical protein
METLNLTGTGESRRRCFCPRDSTGALFPVCIDRSISISVRNTYTYIHWRKYSERSADPEAIPETFAKDPGGDLVNSQRILPVGPHLPFPPNHKPRPRQPVWESGNATIWPPTCPEDSVLSSRIIVRRGYDPMVLLYDDAVVVLRLFAGPETKEVWSIPTMTGRMRSRGNDRDMFQPLFISEDRKSFDSRDRMPCRLCMSFPRTPSLASGIPIG